MPTLRIVIQGRVQGVGYRDYVLRLADRYQVTGEVWNRSDGWVETIVQHPEPVLLEAFVDELRFGPGRVDAVRPEEYDPAPEYDGFRITFLS